MNRILPQVLISAAAVLAMQPMQAAEPTLPAACQQALDERLPGWQPIPPSEDMAEYARKRSLPTHVAQADFDDDGTTDTALLVTAKLKWETTYHIMVCLAQKDGPRPYFIDEPYCRDGIDVRPKGTRDYNYETGEYETYPTNGVTAYCYEKASATYLYDNGTFRRVVDSD